MKSNQDYVRDVMVQVGVLATEDDTLQRDMQGDSLEASIRRAAFDGVINEILDDNAIIFIHAMRLAEINVLDAAKIIHCMSAVTEMRQKGLNND